jgi:hypothetical protein
MIENKDTVFSLIVCDGCGQNAFSYADEPLLKCPHCTYDLMLQRQKYDPLSRARKQGEQMYDHHNSCSGSKD